MPLGGRGTPGLTSGWGLCFHDSMEMAGLRGGGICQLSEGPLPAVASLASDVSPWDAGPTMDPSTLSDREPDNLPHGSRQCEGGRA